MGDENRSPLAEICPRVKHDQSLDSDTSPPLLRTKQQLLEKKNGDALISASLDKHTGVDGTDPQNETDCLWKRHFGDSGNEEDKCGNPPAKKHKTRRGKSKKRRWHLECDNEELGCSKRSRPLFRTFDDKSKRTVKRRAEWMSQTDAPYNTTQFIIEDHGFMDLSSPDEQSHSESSDKGDMFSSSPEEEECHNRAREYDEFQELCRSVREEKIHKLSKNELEQEYFKLEDRVEKLEHEIRVLKQKELEGLKSCGSGTSTPRPDKSPVPEGDSLLVKPAEDPSSFVEEFTDESQSSNIVAEEVQVVQVS